MLSTLSSALAVRCASARGPLGAGGIVITTHVRCHLSGGAAAAGVQDGGGQAPACAGAMTAASEEAGMWDTTTLRSSGTRKWVKQQVKLFDITAELDDALTAPASW